jgi:hypothetical protein
VHNDLRGPGKWERSGVEWVGGAGGERREGKVGGGIR